MVADHLAAHHRQRFALRRVGLARHDRGAEFVAAGSIRPGRSAAGAEQADIVGDLEQRGAAALSAPGRTPRRRAPPGSNLFGARRTAIRSAGDAAAEGIGEMRQRLSPVPTAVPPWASDKAALRPA